MSSLLAKSSNHPSLYPRSCCSFDVRSLVQVWVADKFDEYRSVDIYGALVGFRLGRVRNMHSSSKIHHAKRRTYHKRKILCAIRPSFIVSELIGPKSTGLSNTNFLPSMNLQPRINIVRLIFMNFSDTWQGTLEVKFHRCFVPEIE